MHIPVSLSDFPGGINSLSPLTIFLSLHINFEFHWSKAESKFLDTLKMFRNVPETPLFLSLHYPKYVIKQLIHLRFLDQTYTYSQFDKEVCALDEYTVPQFPLKASDLMSLGIVEGKELGKILKDVKKIWERSPWLSKEDCFKLIKR